MKAHFTEHTFERHSHETYSIGVTASGVQTFHCGGTLHASLRGDVILFNPDDDHDGCRGTADGFRYTMGYVPAAFVASCVDGKRYFAKPHAADRQLAEAFGALSASLAQTPAESLRAETLMRAFLGTMLARHGERPQAGAGPAAIGAATLARVKDYIRTYHAHDITVADLAAVAGLSRAHLTRAFTAAYHMPPHVYLNAVRIAQAQALIRRGTPLATVALECGFADQSHLTRRFKGSVGVTPSAWQKMQRAAAFTS
jgi:AraC-like DNA-binding protein